MFSQIAYSLGRMVEIDLNSLFTSFFSMVRAKVVAKVVTKILNKRLFEMKKNLYVVQFKVEGCVVGDGESDMGGDDDDRDNNDQADGDEQGMKELEHDMVEEKETPKRGTKRGHAVLVMVIKHLDTKQAVRRWLLRPICFRMMTVLKGWNSLK
jgi:hypothetical protein